MALPEELPQIQIRVNGVDGFVFFPEEAITASLDPRFGPEERPRPQYQNQRRNARKDSPYMVARRAEQARHDNRYESESTLRVSRPRSRARSNRRSLALREQVSNQERLLALRMDTDHYDEKTRRRLADIAELENFADEIVSASRPNRKHRSQHRALDNRKSNASPALTPAAGPMMGRFSVYLPILALVLIYVCLRIRTPAQES